jgi:hypothetical protein
MKTASKILLKMNEIEKTKPLALLYESDARHTWPDRWLDLKNFIQSFLKFQEVYCSQCGGEFGPRDSGYSHCKDHQKERHGN